MNRFYQRPTPFLQDYVPELLLKKVIEPVSSILLQARLFCVDKKDSSRKRVILDLSDLNNYIRYDKSKMLTIAQIRILLPKGAYTCAVDLTDTYWHVPMARHRSPYLGFGLGHQAYMFRIMPFGLNIAPKVFTKLDKAVIQELRKQGILVAAYLDDWLIWDQSPEECRLKVTNFLQHLGFLINFKKVHPDASENVHLARSPRGPGDSYSFLTNRKETRYSQVCQSLEKIKGYDATTIRKGPGVPPFCCQARTQSSKPDSKM